MINPITSPILSEIMTVHELARYLKTSDAKVYRLARKGEVPAFRIGKSWRFKKGMIELWIRQKTDMACDPVSNLQTHMPEKL